ncbi:MAG: HIT family protein [Bacilli bacterium]|nr:HIT family protein [Bacilli bacterium]MDD4282912.1 HIT family protein [Bacilli bacterium]MDD4719108.1 HIT family protein [Bacilli bacterium]
MSIEELRLEGICPTCYNFKHGGVYPKLGNKLLYEDELLMCFFESRPRSKGHTIILVKEHYQDMSYLSDEICSKVYLFSKMMMNILKEVLKAERIYLCTMCDGEPNHFHLQLIPRYSGTKIGSTNFVNERQSYIENLEIINAIKNKLNIINNL